MGTRAVGWSGWVGGQSRLGPIPELGGEEVGAMRGGLWGGHRPKRGAGAEGGADMAPTWGTPEVLPLARAPVAEGTLRTPLVPLMASGPPPLALGNRREFCILWWVFFIIILYKNKLTFRNSLLLSLSLALSLFFLSFQLFIEVGYNL